MPLILGTNSIKDTGYDVANSCRFNDGSSDALIKTLADPGGAGNRNKWTFSTWVKRGQLGVKQMILSSYQSDNYLEYIRFNANDTLEFKSVYNGSTNGRRTTNRVFRDPSSWMHLVFIWDKDNGTSDHKMRIYVNGTEETSFSTSSAPSQATTLNADGQDISIGQLEGVGDFFDGYLSETVFNDGQAYTADNYGEFDSDSPTIWKPIDVSGLTFGTTGFYLDFEDSSNLGNDANGGTDFTENNLTSIDQSTDTCTNNFNTPNPLWGMQSIRVPTFAEGNLKITGDGDTQHHQTMSTFAFNQGKWFWEAKFTVSADIGKNKIGIMSTELGSPQTAELGDQSGSCLYINEDGGDFRRDNATVDQNAGTFSHNQIISVALNMDDGEISIYRAGSLIVDALSIGNSAGTFVTPASMHYRDAGMEFNFGSPPYSESGGNSDGNGYGNFSMSVPSGYFAINSKNLAEYG
jgi:hypothetical protein